MKRSSSEELAASTLGITKDTFFFCFMSCAEKHMHLMIQTAGTATETVAHTSLPWSVLKIHKYWLLAKLKEVKKLKLRRLCVQNPITSKVAEPPFCYFAVHLL